MSDCLTSSCYCLLLKLARWSYTSRDFLGPIRQRLNDCVFLLHQFDLSSCLLLPHLFLPRVLTCPPGVTPDSPRSHLHLPARQGSGLDVSQTASYSCCDGWDKPLPLVPAFQIATVGIAGGQSSRRALLKSQGVCGVSGWANLMPIGYKIWRRGWKKE